MRDERLVSFQPGHSFFLTPDYWASRRSGKERGRKNHRTTGFDSSFFLLRITLVLHQAKGRACAIGWHDILDPLVRIESSNLLNQRTKKSIAAKVKNLLDGVSSVEHSTGTPEIRYPPYFVEPVLRVVESSDNIGGLGVLYARTIPVEANEQVGVLVEISAPLLLYGTKSLLKTILAHEFLHYVELVKRFSRMDVISQITSSSVFEEGFEDASRAIDPALVYKDKKLISLLKKRETTGFTDDKLNEKCRTRWIEKGMPTARLPVGRNQASVSVSSLMRTRFDPGVMELIARLH